MHIWKIRYLYSNSFCGAVLCCAEHWGVEGVGKEDRIRAWGDEHGHFFSDFHDVSIMMNMIALPIEKLIYPPTSPGV